MNSDIRVVRGLGIATIVLSSIGIAAGLAVALLMGVASTSLNDPVVVNALVEEMQSSGSSSAFDDPSAYSSYDFSGMSQDEVMEVASASIMLLVGLSVGFVVVQAVCLVAGIMALRASKDPAKLGAVFGWSIAAAVVSLFVGSIISLVLFILLAVFSSRARKAYAVTGGGYQPPMPGQPYQQQPNAPQQLGQPAQPQFPQQPGSSNPAQQGQVPPVPPQPPAPGSGENKPEGK